ncbi:uncharacterized protein ACRADG_008248 [Cochliomyia hominivorax]
MLPVTRANLDHICCICLMDIRPSVFTQNVYDVKGEKNMSKVLKLTAHITVLKNPINQRYINDYCRKICEICYLKTQYSYSFREKIIASTASVKELLESGELDDLEVERLQYFCRICLNRQEITATTLDQKHFQWLKNCSGIRFNSLVDMEKFRIKSGTNINEIAEIDDKYFPRHLCSNCLKKLQNVEEFRKSATQSFEYMISVMGDMNAPEFDLVTQHHIKNLKDSVIWKEELQAPTTAILQFEDNNIHGFKEEESFSTDVVEVQIQQDIDDNVDPIPNAIDFTDTSKLEEKRSENLEDLMEILSHYSDENEDDTDANFAVGFSDDDSSIYNSEDENTIQYIKETPPKNKEAPLNKDHKEKKTRIKQCNETNKNNCSLDEKSRTKEKERKTNLKKDVNGSTKKRGKSKKSDQADTTTTETEIICGECSKAFTSNYALKRHKKNVHTPDSLQKWYICEICSKKFKRRKHLDDHVKTVHEKLREFKCSQCTKSFSTNGSKKNHELTHTDYFPYVCEWCQKGFRRSNQLKIHLEIHTTKPELLCPICKRSQKSTEDLQCHLKSHDEKRLQCPWCGKLFSRSSHLKDHQNAVHLKLRPFKCDFCELAFGDRKARLVHQKSHTEDRPITCSVCKRGFKTRSTFKRHINESGHESDFFNDKPKKSKKRSEELQRPNYILPFNSIFEV